VQAVVQVEGANWCYVQSEQGVERRDVELGRTNDKFVHVTKGLSSGDSVILNPMAIIDESKKSEIAPDAGAGETPEIPPPPAEGDSGGAKARGGAAGKAGGAAGKAGGAARFGGGRPTGGAGGGGK